MHVGRNRIFVGNLPPLVNENDIKEQFGKYGNVVSVEIKHRKENASINENVSPVFAFVTIETDKNQLHECFQSIANYNWDGYYVKLEIAKESFLERLKREREEAQLNKTTPTNNTTNNEEINNLPSCSNININNKPSTSKKVLSSDDDSSESSSSDSDSDESSSDAPPKKDTNGVIEDLVIKNNKNKHLTNGKITIESVSSPIHVHTPKFGKLQKEGEKLTPADEKRLNSLYKLKESQNQQKSLIKNALSQIDTGNSNKIIFDDEGQSISNNKRKQNFDSNDGSSKKDKVALFEEDDDDDTINFQIKDQFEGKKGQRLLELQSRYTNDKRFTLDSRFAEDDDNDEEVNDKVEDDEKQKQMEILENVIGRKLNKTPQQDVNKKNNTPRGMLRYDPTNVEHSKFEIKDKPVNNNNDDDDESTSEGENEKVEEAPVEVSKEKFYKVTDNLKQAFKETEGFSLLSMFGKTDVEDKKEPEKHETTAITKSITNERNPFRYDSSDSENEDAPRRKFTKTDVNQIKPVFNRPLLSGEKFFFQNEDERLKDGLNFLKKFGVGTENTEKFAETRQQIKEIIRLKLRNVQRNNRPFQKKIGHQHQQHKRIKIKKANKN